ncbi:MAG: UDP-N-acetylmuramate dehydrogenase [Terriglobia bacterium]
MEILANEPLKPYTTFKIGGPARYFARLAGRHEIPQAIEFASSHGLPIFVLGGGSNLLVSDAGLDALVLHPASQGITQTEERDGDVLICAEAGEPWDRVVAHAAANQWWGIENLSHIPGHAGAALVQNIGAYGQQLSSVLERAEIADLTSGNVRLLARDECGLGYRRSIFNSSHKGRFLILNLTLRLSRIPQPHLAYPDVKAWFEARNIKDPSINEIRQAIISIRDRKFPYPRVEKGGNAGSFFKNLTLSQEEYDALDRSIQDNFGAVERDRLHELRSRFVASNGIRIPTAFLMEICGLKGFRLGGAQVNETQPLVLLNQGGATARDVLLLAQHVRQTLFAKTGMKVALELELAGFTQEEIDAFMAIE